MAIMFFALGLIVQSTAWAQLAITEAMPVARLNTNTSFLGAEYWELTNFGTNQVNLHGYGFHDVDATRVVKYPFTNLVLRSGESVIFLRLDDAKQSVTNLPQFRAWWGETNLPPDLQLRTWGPRPGLSGWDGDEIWLLDAAGQVVDRVTFGRARPGQAFTYDASTGLFGTLSSVGIDGAFAAGPVADVGSPGRTSGAVPVHFLQQPADEVADLGASVTLRVLSGGRPVPQFQWFHDGVPVPGATNTDLILSHLQPALAGTYQIWIGNGLTEALSAPALLTVNTNPTPPSLVSPPADVSAYAGQTARFQVLTRGLPPPALQWSVDGVEISGATNATLEFAVLTNAPPDGAFSVHVSNALGSFVTSATLTVTPRPDFRFSEVMALPSEEEDNRHFDWFELANFDTRAVNLLGWRFSDQPSFARAVTITNSIVLAPGETIVFAERLDRERFRTWWGHDRLPESIRVVTYSGFGLGAFGDVVFLWNAAAIDPNDWVATVSWAGATAGVSFECEHVCDVTGVDCEDRAERESQAGWRGAFRASEGGHIGSPGYLENPPVRILSFSVNPETAVTLRARVIEGRTFRLRRAPSLEASSWTPLLTQVATNNVATWSDQPPPGPTWFYHLEQLP